MKVRIDASMTNHALLILGTEGTGGVFKVSLSWDSAGEKVLGYQTSALGQ